MNEALEYHYRLRGKVSMRPTTGAITEDNLKLAYTPGVAEACRQIVKSPEEAYALTRKWNTVAVVTDGSAVLGLGNIGALAGLPVMEGKAALFSDFAGIDAIPILLSTQDTDEIVSTVKNIAVSFGGINLEDIAAPRCFEVEKRLIEELDIPVFHDDQHGTAIVVLAALINALKVTGRDKRNVKVAVNGAGAAGASIAKLLLSYGIEDIVVNDKDGILHRGKKSGDPYRDALAERTNREGITGGIAEAVKGADVFIGVSVKGALTGDMVKTMNRKPIVFAMANPEPEIYPQEALAAGAAVVGTGRSDFENQINNVMAFPGIFRGALDARARRITEGMQLKAALAISGLVGDGKLCEKCIVPKVFDKAVVEAVSQAVKSCVCKNENKENRI